jgi:transcriptional regulator with XRE-family HTH domain
MMAPELGVTELPRKVPTTPFGAYLRRERVRANRSLHYVAERVGVSRVFLSLVERGLRTPLGSKHWPALVKAIPAITLANLRALAPLKAGELTEAERKLAVLLLRQAAEKFGNHGCNDFDLVKDGGLTPDESFQIRQADFAMNPDIGPADTNHERPHKNDHYAADFAMMGYLARRLEGEL